MKKFITFEGGEGSGKSTQTKLLSKSLFKIDEDNLITREPGGTKFSEKIRNLIVKNHSFNISSDIELLLIYASRCDHVMKTIIPNLKNKNVICDRFILSTYCYQLNSENASKKIKFLHENFAFNLMPNITFLLDINPQKGIKRSLKVKKKETKFENKDLKFHKAVREKFLKLSKRNKNVLTINGEKTISQIHIQIIDLINRNNFFKNKLPYSV